MYNMRDLYPNFGTQSTHEATTPDPDEQEAYANVESGDTHAVKPDQGKHLLLTAGAILVLVIFLGK